jgi:molybdopterin-guanine dinucleotide biosynthesis protein A
MKRNNRQPGGGKGVTEGRAREQVDFFSNLPVFCLTGGSEVLRAEFLDNLADELAKCSLRMAVLHDEDRHSPYAIALLARRHDLVIVNGEIDLPVQRIYCGESKAAGFGELSWPGPDAEPVRTFTERLVAKLDEFVCRTPVWGCVLIGGKSSRMGRPKHLIQDDRGRTWLENTIGLLQPVVDGLVVSGGGELPEPVADTVRLADIPGVVGPLTGIVAACRWQPRVSWLVVACDMPHISAEAIKWLLSERRAGCWGRVPRLAGSDHCEPLFAWYDVRSAQLFEEQLFTGNLRIGNVAGHRQIDNPIIPEPLRYAFCNVNTPAELSAALP